MKHATLAMLTAAALLAGCGKKETTESLRPTTESGKKSITIWWAQWAPADGLQELGKEFETETGIEVQVNQIPWRD